LDARVGRAEALRLTLSGTRAVPLVRQSGKGRRIGLAKGAFKVPETIDADNAAVEALIAGRTG
jgi:hypothetical protein